MAPLSACFSLISSGNNDVRDTASLYLVRHFETALERIIALLETVSERVSGRLLIHPIYRGQEQQ